MRKFILAVLLAGSAAAPALAQDAAPPFTGPRVEALVGYDEGFVYGAGVGYDFQTGPLVLGIEAEITDSTYEDCINDPILPGNRSCAVQGRDLYAGARVGTVIGSKALLYAKGGYVNTRVGFEFDDGTATGAGDFEFTDDLDGFRLGGGVELAVARNIYVKGEYRYSNFERGSEKHDGVFGIGLRF